MIFASRIEIARSELCMKYYNPFDPDCQNEDDTPQSSAPYERREKRWPDWVVVSVTIGLILLFLLVVFVVFLLRTLKTGHPPGHTWFANTVIHFSNSA
jgi:hypothetical protein